ncbi:MAG: GNAT family N-acetyltransferase [Methylophilaceae bacterium]
MAEYSVLWVNSESDISSELWQACFPAPFEGRWWYQTLERCGITDQFTFLYAVVSDASGPVALAPAFVMNVPMKIVLPPALVPIANVLGLVFPSALYQRTLFIGSPCSDEGRVGMLAHANRLSVVNTINKAMSLQAVKLNASMRVWKDFPQTYEDDFSASSKHLFSVVSFPGTVAELPNATKDSYFNTLKSSRRNKLKKKLRLAAEAPVDVEIIQQPNASAMDEIFDLFWQTYEKGTTKFERLNRTFFDLIAQESYSYFIVLRDRNDNKMVAFMLCFALGKHVINKFIGLDYQKPKEWFLYFRLWEAAIDWTASQQATSIQSGQTGYSPKIELGHTLVPLTNYCAHKNPFIHWVYAKVAKTINWDTLDEDLSIYLKAYPESKPKI